MKRPSVVITAAMLIHFTLLHAQVPYDTSPAWISTDVSNYSTGAAWADINNDGWLDLVVANGNDMARQHVVAYYNTGVGSLPPFPNWQSGDVDYNGHLSVGDVNHDGFPDVAVSVYIGAAGFSERGIVKLYMNQAGTLSSHPSWRSKDSMWTFSCAFGDADGDGDLDLAVAAGESYYNHPERNRIYFNNGGVLDSLPGWMSEEEEFSYDVGWADFDNDGDLDLVFANDYGPNRIYENDGSTIGTSPVWSSTDGSEFANSLAIGDVDGDGYRDLAISDNNQIGGTGRFKIYLNNAGTLSTKPFWSSNFSGYGSGIALVDIDNDADLDLITGGWWEPCRIYVNETGTFTPEPQWTSTTNSVVEAIVPADYDEDGLDTITVEHIGDGSQKLVYMARRPIHRVLSILMQGDTVAADQYCVVRDDGWISFKTALSSDDTVSITAVVSRDLDFAVSNWDPSIGNYVFRNSMISTLVDLGSHTPSRYHLSQNFPNPFNPATVIRYELPRRSHVSLKVYNALGQEMATLVDEEKEAGRYEVTWYASGVASGIYFSRLYAGEFVDVKKMVIVR